MHLPGQKQRRTTDAATVQEKETLVRSPGQKMHSNSHTQKNDKTGAKPGKKPTPGPTRGGSKTRLGRRSLRESAREKKTEGLHKPLGPVRRGTLLRLFEVNGVCSGHREAPQHSAGVLALESNRQSLQELVSPRTSSQANTRSM
jgi:hypothetical protein